MTLEMEGLAVLWKQQRDAALNDVALLRLEVEELRGYRLAGSDYEEATRAEREQQEERRRAGEAFKYAVRLHRETGLSATAAIAAAKCHWQVGDTLQDLVNDIALKRGEDE